MLLQVLPEAFRVKTELCRDLCRGESALFQPGDGFSVFGGGVRIVFPHGGPVHRLAFLIRDAFPLTDQILVPGLQVVVETSYRYAGPLGYFPGGHGCSAVQVESLGIFPDCFRGRDMKRPASRYLAPVLLSGGLFAYLDAVPDQFLVVEYQVLFQSGVGDIATVGCLLHRDITVGTQKLHRFGILLLAPRARTTGRPSSSPNRFRARSRNSNTSG